MRPAGTGRPSETPSDDQNELDHPNDTPPHRSGLVRLHGLSLPVHPWRLETGVLAAVDGRVAPVTNDDWSEQSQTTVAATSSGRPTRRIGVDRPASRCASSPAAARWWVRIGPGATTFTRMPWSA